MEFTSDTLMWLFIGGVILVVIYIFTTISIAVYIYRLYKKSEEQGVIDYFKMAEMEKEADELRKRNKDKMDILK